MADESLADRIDLSGALALDEGEEERASVGRRIGGVIGAVVGRRIGTIIGAWAIDDLILERQETKDGEEASGDDAEDEETEESDDEASADESGDDDETESGGPQRVEDLQELSYRELQSLAKEVDVKANLARDEMTTRIADALDLDE